MFFRRGTVEAEKKGVEPCVREPIDILRCQQKPIGKQNGHRLSLIHVSDQVKYVGTQERLSAGEREDADSEILTRVDKVLGLIGGELGGIMAHESSRTAVAAGALASVCHRIRHRKRIDPPEEVLLQEPFHSPY